MCHVNVVNEISVHFDPSAFLSEHLAKIGIFADAFIKHYYGFSFVEEITGESAMGDILNINLTTEAIGQWPHQHSTAPNDARTKRERKKIDDFLGV